MSEHERINAHARRTADAVDATGRQVAGLARVRVRVIGSARVRVRVRVSVRARVG